MRIIASVLRGMWRVAHAYRLMGSTESQRSPADMLADIGRALYGEHWRIPLARDIGVDDGTIRRWMSGRTPLGPQHGVFIDALTLLRRRAGEIAAVAAELNQWLQESTRKPDL